MFSAAINKKFLSLAVITLGFLISFVIAYGQSAARNSSVSLKKDGSLFILAISDPDGISEFSLTAPGKNPYGGGLAGCPTIFNSKNVSFFDPEDFTPVMTAVITDCKNNVLELALLPPKDGITRGKVLTPDVAPIAPPPDDSVREKTPEQKKKEAVPAPVSIANTTSKAPFTIGAWDDRFGVTELFSGLINEVFVYKKALSASEVKTIFKAGSAGDCFVVPDVVGAISCGDLFSDLISWWSGDRVSGTIVSDNADPDGGNRGTISGEVIFVPVPGKIRAAFKFNGSNGYITMGNPASLNFGTGPFSLEVLFNWNGKDGVNNIIRKSNYPVSGPGAGYWLRIGGGNLEFFTGETTGIDGEPRGIISAPISSNTWHHIVATRDSSGTMNLYVNGQLKGTAQASITEKAPEPEEEPEPTESLEDVEYPLVALGNCGSEEECLTYCDDESHFSVCLAFAKEYGLITEEEFQDAQKFKKIDGGPGGCNSRASCETYCNTIDHLDECIAFADTNDVLTPEELAEAKQFQQALKRGVKPPAACTNKNTCEVYCNNPDNIEECLAFAEEAGFIEGDELAQARKFMEFMKRGETPGDCRSREQCDNYCSGEGHLEECIAFAEKAGFLSDEEKEMIRKTGGKGPGNCRSKEQCEAYCEANQEECFNWAQEKGVLPEEDLARMREGLDQFREQFDKMPPEVVQCFKDTVGEETLNKMLAGEPVFARDLGDKIQACFESFAGSFGGPGGFPGGPGGPGGGGFSGPGGCTNVQECTDFCLNNIEACKDFTSPGEGGPPGGFPNDGSGEFPGGPGGPGGFPGGPGGLPGGIPSGGSFVGPGGCATPEECIRYCSTPGRGAECDQFKTPATAPTYPTHDPTISAQQQQQYQQQPAPTQTYPATHDATQSSAIQQQYPSGSYPAPGGSYPSPGQYPSGSYPSGSFPTSP